MYKSLIGARFIVVSENLQRKTILWYNIQNF